jgi:hypothetical protein
MKSTATLNPVLSGYAAKFMRDSAGFVGARLFPAFSSGVQSADYYVFDAENALGVPQNIRHAAGAAFKRIVSKLSDDHFACKDYGLEHPVADTERRKYASALDADLSAIRRLTDIIKINHEIRVKDLATNTALIQNAAVAAKWDIAGSNPKDDVDAAKEAIRLSIGVRPNTMVISRPIMNALELHPKLQEVFKYTSAGLVNEQKLAQFLNIGQVLVAEQVIASNQEGQAVTAADIWGDSVVLAHVNPGQDLKLLNLGRTFFWNEFGGIGEDGVPIQVMDYRDETVESDIHRARHFTDEKLVGAGAGYILTDVLS